MNDTLRHTLAAARLRDVDVATRLGVDPKTVQRWVAGRTPYPRHRWALSDLLGLPEHELWPDLVRDGLTGEPSTGEVVGVYPCRRSVPRGVWRHFFGAATREVGVLVYSGLFLAEDVGGVGLLADRARAGAKVRVLLGDPAGTHVAERGVDEGIDDAMAARIRNALVLYRPLLAVDGAEIGLHDSTLYTSIYRADDDLLLNTHVYGLPGAKAPVLHLRRTPGDDMAGTYLESFERVWAGARPLQ